MSHLKEEKDDGNYYQYSNKGVIYKFDLDQLTLDELRKFDKMSEKQRMRFIASYELNKSAPMFDEISLKAMYAPYSKSNERYADYAYWEAKKKDLKLFDGMDPNQEINLNQIRDDLRFLSYEDLLNIAKKYDVKSPTPAMVKKYINQQLDNTEIYSDANNTLTRGLALFRQLGIKKNKEDAKMQKGFDALTSIMNINFENVNFNIEKLTKINETLKDGIVEKLGEYVKNTYGEDVVEEAINETSDKEGEPRVIFCGYLFEKFPDDKVIQSANGFFNFDTPVDDEPIKRDDIEEAKGKEESETNSVINTNREEIEEKEPEKKEPEVKNPGTFTLESLGEKNRQKLNEMTNKAIPWKGDNLLKVYMDFYDYGESKVLKNVRKEHQEKPIPRDEYIIEHIDLDTKNKVIEKYIWFPDKKRFVGQIIDSGNEKNDKGVEVRYKDPILTIDFTDTEKAPGRIEYNLEDETTTLIQDGKEEKIKFAEGYGGSIFTQLKDKLKSKFRDENEMKELKEEINELKNEINELKKRINEKENEKENERENERENEKEIDKPQIPSFLKDIITYDPSKLIKPEQRPIQPKIEEEFFEDKNLSKILSDRRKDIAPDEYSDDDEEEDWGEGYSFRNRKSKPTSKVISLSEFLKRYS